MAKAPAIPAAPDPIHTAHVLIREGAGWALYAVPLADSTLRDHGEALRTDDSLAMCLAILRQRCATMVLA